MGWGGERGERGRFACAEARGGTDRLANGLRGLGGKVGEAGGLYMPRLPETVMALVGCCKVGAMASPSFSG